MAHGPLCFHWNRLTADGHYPFARHSQWTFFAMEIPPNEHLSVPTLITAFPSPMEDIIKFAADSATNDETTDIEEQGSPTSAERFSNAMTVIFAGIALASDGFQNYVFNLINLFFANIYGPSVFTSSTSTQIANSLLVGAIIGQLSFGIIIDRLGRKIGLLITTLLIVVGTILCSTAYGAGGSVQGLFWALTVYRGITGVGVGGEYPCSSTSASEASDVAAPSLRGGVFVMVTNFMLVLGNFIAVSVSLILLSIFGENTLEPVWRITFGLGCILPLSVFWFRLNIANSRRYREEAITSHVPYALAFRRYWKRLLGSAGCWFLYDFVVFPNGTLSSTIINNFVPDKSLLKTAEYQFLMTLLCFPGILLGAWAVDKIGRKKTMAIGFLFAGTLGIIIGCSYEQLKGFPVLFVIFYALFISSANFGPGDCLGLVSAEIYPTAIRGTFYGISAAVGKIGAAVGTQVLIPLRNSFEGDTGIRVMFWVCGAVGFLGAILCIALVPDYSTHSLEYEDRAFRLYLTEKQWETEFGFRDWDKVLERLERVHERKLRAASRSGRSNLITRALSTNYSIT